jgi:hypothetical protein
MSKSPDYIAAPPGELYWRKEVCPHRGAKVLLKTIGGVAWIGHWGPGEVGQNFTAWCPLPKDGAPAPRIQDAPLLARIRFAIKLIFQPRA